MEEYRIDLKVRNNVILYKIEKAGYKTLGEFCRMNNLMSHYSRLGRIVNMTDSPLNTKGEFHLIVERIAELLNCSPLDLFTDTQIHTLLKTNKRSLQVNEAEMKFMLENSNNQKMLEEIVDDERRDNEINKQLNTLSPREQKVINMRFGMGDYSREYSLDEVGESIECSRERVRQIEAKALRKLRHHTKADPLREFLSE